MATEGNHRLRLGARASLLLLPCSAAAASGAGCGQEEVNPAPAQIPLGAQGCQLASCHGDARTGPSIEQAHPGAELSCTDCHGGDPTATTATPAHVAPTGELAIEADGYLKNLGVAQLDAVDPDYLRFVNPGDYRVAERSCGAGSQANGGSGCHQTLVETAPRSIMTTFTGHFVPVRHQAGLQGRDALVGSRAVESLAVEGARPRGAVARIDQAQVPHREAPRDELHTALDHYVPKNCTKCHAADFGLNDAPGNYRSSGCTSCHVVYEDDGRSRSSDPSRSNQRLPHPARHEITTAIPTGQCEHCHYQGARIGLLYQGILEWGFSGEPPAEPIDEIMHGRDPGFYLDGGQTYPADLHHRAGMQCADCHVGKDVHGDGQIYSMAKFQVSIRCENCHGTVDAGLIEGQATAPLLPEGQPNVDCQPPPDPEGRFLNCNGDPLKGLRRRPDGRVELSLSSGDGALVVPQVHDLLRGGLNPRMNRAMGRDAVTQATHTEILECEACHTSHRQYCFGCHVTMDYGSERRNHLTGLLTPGSEVTERFDTSFDLLFMGVNHRGKIGTACPSMQLFVSAVEPDGQGGRRTLIDHQIRTTATGKRGFNWSVDAPHTTSRNVQPCSRCHADASRDCSTEQARQSYGFGTGRFTHADGSGVTYDLTQMLAADGTALVDFSHEGQGPVPIQVIDRALSLCP